MVDPGWRDTCFRDPASISAFSTVIRLAPGSLPYSGKRTCGVNYFTKSGRNSAYAFRRTLEICVMDKRFDFLMASIALGVACYTAIILVSIAPHLGLTSDQTCSAAVIAAALIGLGLLLVELLGARSQRIKDPPK